MKLFMGVLFATLALNGVLSLPARTEDAEVIGGPRRISTRADDDDDDFTNFKGVIDTGSGYPFLQPNPSVIRVGFFDSFDDLFRRFSERLFPTGFFSRTGSDSDEGDSSELGIPAIDPKKANTTSTVKVVDGHKVEVNETVYGDENSVFKVRVVNIRPLEEGETVDETEHKDIKPVTQGPNETAANNESNESDETREPLEKKASENEIEGNIDEPEHSIAKKENIVETTEETTTSTSIDTTMLPTTEDINAAFVTDNGLEQQEYSAAENAEEELNGANGNGNNEFETNMSEENNSNNSNSDDDNNSNDNIDNVENVEVEHTIENNEDTEEEVNDNLNESSSSSIADVSDKEQENNENNDDTVDGDETNADIEIVNLKKKNSNYSSAIRNKEREDESSSDDDDVNATTVEMHPTFNDEWGSLNEPTNERNDFSNDIDAYDVVPIDLSNDIAVNDAANLPLNPDAEFIDVYGVQHSSNSMPKFEKLSLDHQPPSEDEWMNKPAK